MTPEAGKYYKTNDGRKAFVGYVREDGPTQLIVGHIEGMAGADSWDTNGKWSTSADEHIFDLIEEWKEPARGTVWVNIYPVGFSPIPHISRRLADHRADDNRIACIRVDWVEGQFDE